jgi:hypothetical protein
MRRSRSFAGTLLALAALAGCLGDLGASDPGEEEVSSESSAVAGCTGSGFDIFDQLCGVGESGGKPAVLFRGQWFSLDYNGGDWAIANGVGGQESAVAPVDTVPYDSRDECMAQCGCPGMRCCPGEQSPCCPDLCRTASYYVEQKRQFTWSVGGRTFIVSGTQMVENQRTQRGQHDMKVGRNLSLSITTTDPLDGNQWKLVAHPVRVKNGVADQFQANWEATEPDATTTMGNYNQLFPALQVNVQFTPSVELMSAVKTSSPGTPEMLARSNAAMNRALDAALPQGSSFQSHFEPEALQIAGSVLGRVPGAGGSGSYDLQRFSQFFMNDRRGHVGFSAAGSGERPLAQSTKRDWRFRHNILNYELNFPFLAGICGFVVDVNSYIAGALSFGQRSCFDGVPVDIDIAGNLEFALRAAGGFGCNIFVASASAGLGGGVRAAAEFASSVDASSVPPALTASMNIYSDVNYAAHFKVRVLFWTKKWEKLLGTRRIFQKSASYRLESYREHPQAKICTPGGGPADTGTCGDPAASCDVDGRCIRYDLLPTGELEPTDQGDCLLPECAVEPELPPEDVYEPFLGPAPGCQTKCRFQEGLVSGDGLPDGFNLDLLNIPAEVQPELIINTEKGKRANLYRWADKAVIEISGVGTSGSLPQDIEECVRDFLGSDQLSATATAVVAKLDELRAQGVARSNILIRGHSLGSLDTWHILRRDDAPTNGILLGVPLHVIFRLNRMVHTRGENPFPGKHVGFFVSPKDPVARGFPATHFLFRHNITWCRAKKGIGPTYAADYPELLPSNMSFSVVRTPSSWRVPFSGHFISSYCAVAPVTCFRQ